MEALPAALHNHQRHLYNPSLRRANSSELPPLEALPPPITLNAQPSVDIDLDVDYQSEVAPFLGQCLVRTLLLLLLLLHVLEHLVRFQQISHGLGAKRGV